MSNLSYWTLAVPFPINLTDLAATEHVEEFKYLQYRLRYKGEVDTRNKLNKFQKAVSLINRTLKSNLG